MQYYTNKPIITACIEIHIYNGSNSDNVLSTFMIQIMLRLLLLFYYYYYYNYYNYYYYFSIIIFIIVIIIIIIIIIIVIILIIIIIIIIQNRNEKLIIETNNFFFFYRYDDNSTTQKIGPVSLFLSEVLTTSTFSLRSMQNSFSNLSKSTFGQSNYFVIHAYTSCEFNLLYPCAMY